MKSTITPEKIESPTIKYPCLMQSKESKMIVLFTNNEEGTVVGLGTSQSHTNTLGYNSPSWLGVDSGHWTPFKGKITLEND